MEKKEHLELLKKGVNFWNDWRNENPALVPDFSEANLSGLRLVGANLSSANFFKANLSEASLSGVNFSNSYFNKTNFEKTSIIGCKGLKEIKVGNKCSFDAETIKKSWPLPEEFLLKMGFSKESLNSLNENFQKPKQNLFPVFLSHSWENKNFAGKLYDALIENGVQVWYDEKKMKPGDDILDSIDEGISTYDKMILVCSKESLESWWVEEELDRVFEKERKYRKEQGKKLRLLIPLTIDDALFKSDESRPKSIRKRMVGDFKDWKDDGKFNKALNQLIEALNIDRRDDNIISKLIMD